ncbi:unnamed protein product, partial [marine sediment metagenome]
EAASGYLLQAEERFFFPWGGIVVFLSGKARSTTRHFIDTHFYRNKYEYRSRWNSFTQRLSKADDLEELCSIILAETRETMWVQMASLWIKNEEEETFACLAFEGNDPLALTEVGSESTYVQVLGEEGSPILAKSLLERGEVEKEHKSILNDLSAHICAPLMFRDKMIGFIILGPNLFGESFGNEDNEMLTTLCSQAAMAIYRYQLAEKLVVAQGLESMNRLSSFIIHDLKNSVSMLSMVVQNSAANFHKPEFQKDATLTIASSVGKMKQIVERLSFPKIEDLELQCS